MKSKKTFVPLLLVSLFIVTLLASYLYIKTNYGLHLTGKPINSNPSKLSKNNIKLDEYDNMRIKWRNSITGGDYDESDPILKNIVTSLGNNAQKLWATMNKSENKAVLWDDMPAPTQSAPITTSYKNLLILARAFSTKGSNLYDNKELLADIVNGLDWMYERKYHENMKQYGNWWDFEIGTPVALNDITVLLYDYLSSEQITHYMDAIYYFQPDPDKSGKRDNIPANVNRKAVGANRIDVSKVAAIRGVIIKDAT
jgi:hyaluronate lyase